MMMVLVALSLVGCGAKEVPDDTTVTPLRSFASQKAPNWPAVATICESLNKHSEIARLLAGGRLYQWEDVETVGRVQCELSGAPVGMEVKIGISIIDVDINDTEEESIEKIRSIVRERGYDEALDCLPGAECWLRGSGGGRPAEARGIRSPYDVDVTLGGLPVKPGEVLAERLERVDKSALLVLIETLRLLPK